MKSTLLIILSLCATSHCFPSVTLGLQENQDITEITLEMKPGSYGSGREFKIVFRQDGTASYEGKANVKLEGKYTGAVSKEDFSKLAELIKSRNFSALKSTFPSSRSTALAADRNMPTIISATVITSIVKGGKRRTIERVLNTKINNPDAPAKELLEIENAITALAVKIKWQKDER